MTEYHVTFRTEVTALVTSDTKANAMKMVQSDPENVIRNALYDDDFTVKVVGAVKAEDRLRGRAAALIASADHRGNHGFKGEALKAWRKQRGDLLVALRAIKAGRRATQAMSEAHMTNRCPRDFDPEHGTNGGEAWVDAAASLIHDSRYGE